MPRLRLQWPHGAGLRPGATEETPLFGASRSRGEPGPWTAVYAAEDLVEAWR